VPLTIEQQNGNRVVADVGGGAGLALQLLLLGSSRYEGTVTGTRIQARIDGTKPHVEGGCTFTYESVADLTIDGDAIAGTVEHRPQPPKGNGCRPRACETEQRLEGRRTRRP
jgi:hypothetical protein